MGQDRFNPRSVCSTLPLCPTLA